MKEFEIWIGRHHLGQGYDPATESTFVGKESSINFKVACLKHELRNKLDYITKATIYQLGQVVYSCLFFQHKMEIRKEKKAVLQVLMMYRNVGAHELDWIKALNAVDLVFHDNPSVIEKYHKYLALTEPTVYRSGAHVQAFVELLCTMALYTGYKNLTEDNIRLTYSPEGLALHYPGRFEATSPSSVSSVSDSPKIEDRKKAND